METQEGRGGKGPETGSRTRQTTPGKLHLVPYLGREIFEGHEVLDELKHTKDRASDEVLTSEEILPVL